MGWDRDAVVRRGLHLVSPVLLAYYLLPDDLGIGWPRPQAAFLVWIVTLAIEVTRLVTGLDVVGLREYERGQVSAYFWGGTALLLGFLLFPPPFVAVALCGMAWVDPLCALTKERGGYPYVPLVAYGVLALVALRILTPWSLASVALLGAVAAVVAVAAEYPSLRHVDDDFTTQMAPLLALTGLGALL